MNDTQDIDIEAYLTERKQIAIIWSTEDVQEVRPDLSEDQAWEVLQLVSQQRDATMGVTWETLEYAAESIFGDAPDNDEA